MSVLVVVRGMAVGDIGVSRVKLASLSAVGAVHAPQAVAGAERLAVGVGAGAHEGCVQATGAVPVACDDPCGVLEILRTACGLERRVFEHLASAIGEERLVRVVANPGQVLLEERAPIGQ
jgi:hypothetical protein